VRIREIDQNWRVWQAHFVTKMVVRPPQEQILVQDTKNLRRGSYITLFNKYKKFEVFSFILWAKMWVSNELWPSSRSWLSIYIPLTCSAANFWRFIIFKYISIWICKKLRWVCVLLCEESRFWNSMSVWNPMHVIVISSGLLVSYLSWGYRRTSISQPYVMIFLTARAYLSANDSKPA